MIEETFEKLVEFSNKMLEALESDDTKQLTEISAERDPLLQQLFNDLTANPGNYQPFLDKLTELQNLNQRLISEIYAAKGATAAKIKYIHTARKATKAYSG